MYTPAETLNAFQWDGELTKVPLPMEASRPYLIHGSLGPRESAQNGILISSAVFAELTHA